MTIQLDGLGRQLSELSPEPGAPDGSDGPVFVDESGRRSKTLRRLGWVLAAICVCYAVTLVVAVLGGNSSAPFLPLSGQEEHKKADEVQVPPAPGQSAGALVSPGASPSSSPSVPVTGGSAAVQPGSPVSDRSSSPGAGSSASAPVVPPKGHTEPAGGTGGTAPTAETSVSAPPAGPGTPPVDPETPPPATSTPPVEPSEPPVQEGAN
ncbi:hypothetical protein AB0N93_12125 [Streptomyces sp. NPDC091267]|uniref:hypothetical protein n=1 Tax=Streptomyces sp. NPDC091267 TaxID=3155195 RepID=UPI00343F4970